MGDVDAETKRRIDEHVAGLVADWPPLTDHQREVIRRAFNPRPLGEEEALGPHPRDETSPSARPAPVPLPDEPPPPLTPAEHLGLERLPPVLTAQQAAQLLGVSKQTVYRAVAAGELHGLQVRGRVVIATEPLLAALGLPVER